MVPVTRTGRDREDEHGRDHQVRLGAHAGREGVTFSPTHSVGDERAHPEFVVFSAVVLELLCAPRYGAVATR